MSAISKPRRRSTWSLAGQAWDTRTKASSTLTTRARWWRWTTSPEAAASPGSRELIAEQVGVNPSTYWAAFSVAENATLIYHLGAGAPLSQLTWVDRMGKEVGKVGEPGIIANPVISPDQSRVSFDVANRREKNVDVWTYNLQNGTSARFTFDPSEETTGVWSRDGKTIAFRAIGNADLLRLKASSGLQADVGLAKLPEGASDFLPNSWSLDGRSLLTTVEMNTGGSSLVLVSVPDGKMTTFLEGGAKRNGQISPDGKWVAYESNETGDWEVFITTYPTAGGKLQVSRSGWKAATLARRRQRDLLRRPAWNTDCCAGHHRARSFDRHAGRRCLQPTRAHTSRRPICSPTTSPVTARGLSLTATSGLRTFHR